VQGGGLTLSYCDDMVGSAAMEGWGALAAEGLYFYDFFTLKFSPVKFVQPLGGVVQTKCVYDFLVGVTNLARFKCKKITKRVLGTLHYQHISGLVPLFYQSSIF